MKWIHYFSKSKINYYIYKLNKGDSIIYRNLYNKYSSIIILHGLIYVKKVFTNKESLPLALLYNDHIITLKNNYRSKYYYFLQAFDTTYILSFHDEDLYKNQHENYELLIHLIKSYKFTINNYEIINNIFNHKYIKHRLIQLILFLSREFGIIHKETILIPIKISQYEIANMLGTNKITINKILKTLSHIISIKSTYKTTIYVKNIFELLKMNNY